MCTSLYNLMTFTGRIYRTSLFNDTVQKTELSRPCKVIGQGEYQCWIWKHVRMKCGSSLLWKISVSLCSLGQPNQFINLFLHVLPSFLPSFLLYWFLPSFVPAFLSLYLPVFISGSLHTPRFSPLKAAEFISFDFFLMPQKLPDFMLVTTLAFKDKEEGVKNFKSIRDTNPKHSEY